MTARDNAPYRSRRRARRLVVAGTCGRRHRLGVPEKRDPPPSHFPIRTPAEISKISISAAWPPHSFAAAIAPSDASRRSLPRQLPVHSVPPRAMGGVATPAPCARHPPTPCPKSPQNPNPYRHILDDFPAEPAEPRRTSLSRFGGHFPVMISHSRGTCRTCRTWVPPILLRLHFLVPIDIDYQLGSETVPVLVWL